MIFKFKITLFWLEASFYINETLHKKYSQGCNLSLVGHYPFQKIYFISLQLQEGKENGIETDERKDDSIVYADLDKSAMSGKTGN